MYRALLVWLALIAEVRIYYCAGGYLLNDFLRNGWDLLYSCVLYASTSRIIYALAVLEAVSRIGEVSCVSSQLYVDLS